MGIYKNNEPCPGRMDTLPDVIACNIWKRVNQNVLDELGRTAYALSYDDCIDFGERRKRCIGCGKWGWKSDWNSCTYYDTEGVHRICVTEEQILRIY